MEKIYPLKNNNNKKSTSKSMKNYSNQKVLKPIIKLYVRIIQNYYKVLNSYICALK